MLPEPEFFVVAIAIVQRRQSTTSSSTVMVNVCTLDFPPKEVLMNYLIADVLVRSIRQGVAGVFAVALLCGCLGAQAMERTVGVIGTTLAGTSFTLEIDALPTYLRSIDFVMLETDYSPAAMAELMVLKIEENYRDNKETGFRASNVNTKPKNKEFDATFVISCSVPINRIRVGALGNPSVPIPRAPGVAFNPNIITFDANFPVPFQGPQPNQPNATMAINGVIPTFDLFRREKVLTNELMTMSVSSVPNVNVPFALLAGVFNPGVFQAPWGDFLDIGSYNGGAVPTDLQVLADGITPGPGILDAFMRTDFTGNWQISLVPPPILNGVVGFAYQTLVYDPTNAPLALRLSNAVQPLFNTGQRFAFTPPVDGAAEIPFTPGFTFDFYGATYTSAFVHENGFITFGGPGALGNVVDAAGALAGQPAVFVNWADWDLTGSQVEVFQFGDEMRLAWGNPATPVSHTGELDAAEFTCILKLNQPLIQSLDAGGILLDHTVLDAGSLSRNDALVGITPGMGLDMNPVSRDLGSLQFGGNGASSLLLQHNAVGAFATRLNVASGADQIYHNGNGLSGRDLAFFPANAAGVEAGKPFAIPSSPNPNDVQAIIGPNILFSGGPMPQTLRVSGFFRYLFSGLPGPTVVLDPAGNAGIGPYPLQISGIMHGSSIGLPVPSIMPQPGFRDFEAIDVDATAPLPPVGSPITVDLEVTFPTGAQFILPGAVTIM